MNPLDSHQQFEVELMNPNPTSSKTKAGPVYRVSFELERDAWQCFMDAETQGMILVAVMQVIESHNPVQPKGGPVSKEAAMWCQDDAPNEFAREQGCANLKEYIYFVCNIKSRRMLDHDEDARAGWDRIKRQFLAWNERRLDEQM